MKSGRQRREEIKGQRNSATQSATRRKQSRARPRVPWETCRLTSRLSRRTRATARLRLLCAAIIRTLLFVVVAVAKRRSGQRTQQKWWYEVALGLRLLDRKVLPALQKAGTVLTRGGEAC